VPTLEWSLVLVLVTLGTLGLLLARQRHDPALAVWALGFWGNGGGFLVPLVGFGLPISIQLLVSGACYFVFAIGLPVGLSYALGMQRHWKLRYGVYAAAWLVVSAARLAWDPSGLAVVATISAFDALFAWECVVLVRHSDAPLALLLRRPFVVFASLYVGCQVGLIVMVPATVALGWLNASDLVLVVLCSSLAFSIVWAGAIQLLDGIKIEARLGAQADELRRLNGLKDRVLAMTSHDLRGPLGNLQIVWADLSNRLTNGCCDPVEQDLLGMVDRSLAGTQSLLENLFAFAESQGGQPDPLAVAELRTVGQSVVDQWLAPAQAKGITLVLDPGPPVFVRAGPEGVHTVLRNLVGNAVKFTPTGGSVTLRVVDGAVPTVEVSDTGLGMDADAIHRSFELDSRSSRPGTSGERGSGFGLLLVKELVKGWGGTLDVESTLGQGTTVRVRLNRVV